jgi:protein-tyrosine phosphatase
MPYGLYDLEGKIFPAYLEANISTVVVLAENKEIMEKSRGDLLMLYKQQGMDFLHLPIKDFGVPDPATLKHTTNTALDLARQGKNIAIHCSGGIGRTGMFAACMAKDVFNLTGECAIAWVREFIPGAVETEAQSQLVNDY